jgi:predicted house-cleaning NTP pyrophosphatase (Maf/HAM1 superfamily)
LDDTVLIFSDRIIGKPTREAAKGLLAAPGKILIKTSGHTIDVIAGKVNIFS